MRTVVMAGTAVRVMRGGWLAASDAENLRKVASKHG